MSTNERDLRRVVRVLAERLLEYAGNDAERLPMFEGDPGRPIIVHKKSCGRPFEYNCECGAVTVTLAWSEDDPDGEPHVDEVEYGDVRVSMYDLEKS